MAPARRCSELRVETAIEVMRGGAEEYEFDEGRKTRGQLVLDVLKGPGIPGPEVNGVIVIDGGEHVVEQVTDGIGFWTVTVVTLTEEMIGIGKRKLGK